MNLCPFWLTGAQFSRKSPVEEELRYLIYPKMQQMRVGVFEEAAT